MSQSLTCPVTISHPHKPKLTTLPFWHYSNPLIIFWFQERLCSKGFEWPQTGLWNLADLICVAYGPISNLNPTTKCLSLGYKHNAEKYSQCLKLFKMNHAGSIACFWFLSEPALDSYVAGCYPFSPPFSFKFILTNCYYFEYVFVVFCFTLQGSFKWLTCYT